MMGGCLSTHTHPLLPPLLPRCGESLRGGGQVNDELCAYVL